VFYHHFLALKINSIQTLSLKIEKANPNQEFQELQKADKDL